MIAPVDRSLLWLPKVQRGDYELVQGPEQTGEEFVWHQTCEHFQSVHIQTAAAAIIIGAAWELNPKVV